MRLLLLLLSVFYTSFVFAALSPVEKQIRSYIIQQKDAQINLLEKLVNVNSGTGNVEGVQQVGELLRPQFEQLGFKTYWIEQPANMGKAGSLMIERKGKQGKRLLLIGHLDTVFAKDSTFRDFSRKATVAKGPGTIDDKGGLVVLLLALQALNDVHALDNTSITIVLTGDEEDSGKPTSISRKPLIDAAKESDVALDFEPTASLNTAGIARRGISDWTIEVRGNESHSAAVFHKNVGAGAIFELSRILNTMRTKFYGEKYLTYNPGIIIGGTRMTYDKTTSEGTVFGKQNVVAKTALARGDFRFLTPAQKASFEKRLAVIVKDSLPGTKSTLSFQAGIPAMPPTKGNMALLKQYSKASMDLGLGTVKPLDAGSRGAGDISHVASFVSANLIGLGPSGMGSHSVIESIDLNSLPTQTERAAILIYRLTR